MGESRLPDKNGREKVRPELKKVVRHQTFTIFMSAGLASGAVKVRKRESCGGFLTLG